VKRLRVAIQGERGSFSEEAATKLLGSQTSVLPCATFAAAFSLVRGRRADRCLVPIENTLAGSVHENYDLLLKYPAEITAETSVRVIHDLIAPPGVSFRAIRKVYSHPVALNQCLDFFGSHTRIERTPFYDTAGSVKHVIASRLPDAAGIASRHAASVYKGRVLAAGIEDDKRNFTRFFLLRRKRRVLPGANKTSIAFGLKNVPGALHRALGVFTERDISLSKIESRPIRGRPWEYVFYADFLRGDDRLSKGALLQLKAVADMVKVLGVYPAA